MKKTMLWLSALALLLIVTVVGLLLGLLSRLQPEQPEATDLETYLAQDWPVFTLRAWSPDTGVLELDYPLRFTYAQMQKYGGRLEELRALPEGNRSTVADLKTALYERGLPAVRAVVVYGVTSDGQTAYTLHADGTVSACWETSN